MNLTLRFPQSSIVALFVTLLSASVPYPSPWSQALLNHYQIITRCFWRWMADADAVVVAGEATSVIKLIAEAGKDAFWMSGGVIGLEDTLHRKHPTDWHFINWNVLSCGRKYNAIRDSNAFATKDDGDDGIKTMTSFVEASLSPLDWFDPSSWLFVTPCQRLQTPSIRM